MAKFKICVTIVLSFLVLTSCIKKPEDVPVENLPPETYCFISHVDTVDTVPAKVTLYWIGNDPDGEIQGYYYSVDNEDTVFTVRTTETFTFSVSEGDTYDFHCFQVWAVDNEGAYDPTPTKVVIPVRNSPPVAFFISDMLPPDTTLTVASFYFGATDIDGDQSVSGFLYRLSTEPETLLHYVPRDSGSVFLTDLDPGERTIYLAAVDESHALSEVVSHTWYVKPVRGQILLMDDANVNQADLFFRNFLDTYYPDGYTVFSVESGLPYSFRDIDYMINNLGFRLIIWYTADQSEHFSNVVNSFSTYLDSRKKLVLISPAILNVLMNPAFPPSPFARNYLGVDSVSAWDKILLRNEKLYPVISGFDTLSCSASIVSRLDGFLPVSLCKIIYTLPTIPARWQGNPACIVTYPASDPLVAFISLQYYALDGNNNADAVLSKLITQELHF
ncbi:MAG TPA: hypothetical protein PLY38_05670 [Candidatus Hydrothermia bacterium]|nr:hypothetical protein [Candidatus Hydrothermae bacterium]MDD3649355.1 hypothetical protein [Candidatus Hydrothermia bacterium]MDD5572549.1 hypothetical protein [Candidatus Hydrothermia bacterium]HOK22770.1 hypothetical protein [Candidatus Hydrothermia bacterium]HOL23479.1 hypothetical protein [Candidatus Hydrothermia bacterium]